MKAHWEKFRSMGSVAWWNWIIVTLYVLCALLLMSMTQQTSPHLLSADPSFSAINLEKTLLFLVTSPAELGGGGGGALLFHPVINLDFLVSQTKTWLELSLLKKLNKVHFPTKINQVFQQFTSLTCSTGLFQKRSILPHRGNFCCPGGGRGKSKMCF